MTGFIFWFIEIKEKAFESRKVSSKFKCSNLSKSIAFCYKAWNIIIRNICIMQRLKFIIIDNIAF